MPRLIKYLDGKNRGLKDVICGASFNLGISEIPGMVNMWGIYTPAKEANMYPKPIQDLSGWNVRSIACNTKVRYTVTVVMLQSKFIHKNCFGLVQYYFVLVHRAGWLQQMMP